MGLTGWCSSRWDAGEGIVILWWVPRMPIHQECWRQEIQGAEKCSWQLCLFGKDDYPTSIEDYLRMMQNHKLTQTVKSNHHSSQILSDGITFAQPGHGGTHGWGSGEVEKEHFKGQMLQLWCYWSSCEELTRQRRWTKQEGRDWFFNVEDEVNQLDADMEGVNMKEWTNFLTW